MIKLVFITEMHMVTRRSVHKLIKLKKII